VEEKAIIDTDRLEDEKEHLKREITSLYHTINEERRKASLTKDLLEGLEGKIKGLKAEGERLEEENHKLQREVASMKESNGWRLIEFFRKLKHVGDPLRLRRVLRILMRHGVPPRQTNSSSRSRRVGAGELRCFGDLKISQDTEGWRPVVKGGKRTDQENVLSLDFRRRIIPVLPNQHYILSFKNLDDSLSGLDLFLATYERLNACSLILKVWSAEFPSGPLRTVEKYALLLLNNYYESFSFEPIQDARGKDFIISIESPDSDFLNCIGIWEVKERESYSEWCSQNEFSDEEQERVRKQSAELNYHPRISVIVPVYKIGLKWLQKAVDSVIDQIYPYWELCLVDDGSNLEEIASYFHELSKKDDRIKCKILSQNRGISEASNVALSFATGEFICFLDHDDELSPNALHEVALLLDRHPQADFIYSDEDKIDLKGKRSDPYFKPKWSPDLLLSNMYTGHMAVFRTSIVEQLGGCRKGYDGAQDYDLTLRITERTEKIYHIPKVLYHWRTLSDSTSLNPDSKEYAYLSGKRCLEDALKRRGIDGVVSEGRWKGSYRVKRNIQDRPRISIIIPTGPQAFILKRCVDSIVRKTAYDNYELIIIDNSLGDSKTTEYLRLLEKEKTAAVYRYNLPFNFSAINNFAAKSANGDHLLFLNNDTEVITEAWLSSLLEHSQRREVGAVGCKLLYPDNRIQHAGVILGINGIAGHAHKLVSDNECGYFFRKDVIQNFSAVTAACMMTRKDVFQEAGGFDDQHLGIAYNDVDFCLRLRKKGYLIVYTPYAMLFHHESLSRGYEIDSDERYAKEKHYFESTWGRLLTDDPYYSPNLSLMREDFALRISSDSD